MVCFSCKVATFLMQVLRFAGSRFNMSPRAQASRKLREGSATDCGVHFVQHTGNSLSNFNFCSQLMPYLQKGL